MENIDIILAALNIALAEPTKDVYNYLKNLVLKRIKPEKQNHYNDSFNQYEQNPEEEKEQIRKLLSQLKIDSKDELLRYSKKIVKKKNSGIILNQQNATIEKQIIANNIRNLKL